jgi:pimeloyl-ACP methyl ester carboxylesterase
VSDRRRRIWRVVRIVWIVLGVASPFVMWHGFNAVDLPPGTLVSDARVEIVRAQDTINVRPRPDDPARTGLIFFPGGLVEPDAYAPMARRLAEQGHHVVIVRLPYRLAPTHAYHRLVFDTARETLTSPPRPWVIGGHSRGAKLAAEFASEHPGQIAGLVLIASTHPRDRDLSTLPPCVPVLKIFGTRDGVAPRDEMDKYRGNLPPHTGYLEIEGANHTQFGYYRYQLFGGRPTIDRETQQRKMLEGILMVLRPQYIDGARPACPGR